ncbi:E3 SUMO-protein ligase RanBP2-like isoform X2 [Brienomyrus brachyistius]|uniref:E3 SUMO-protein ligase RanBP2-like isoform X2 n=1 Tax=Brienomyrus brachyistius TaxID=42636 RepID=UPI0020B4103A|nr:E3 SUMO-protein ligase RanBP2-like isoform X2 [Brienomyrus brachyistius]
MQQNGADADRFLYSVRNASPTVKEAPEKCFFLAKKFLQNREHEQAKRHVSAYLGVKERDPKAHRLLGLIFEKEGDVNKAVGCYKRSVDLDPRQKDVVLKVAELLCDLPETDSRAEFWVDKAAKLLPNHRTVFQLKEKLLSAQGQRGRNQLFNLLKSQLKVCPSDPYINVKLVQLYCSDGQLKEAVDHCLAVGRKRDMRYSLDWYSTVMQTVQEYLTQPSVLSNHSLCSLLRRELLLAHCNLLRLTLFEPGVEQSVKTLQSFDQAMQSVKMASGNTANGLTELLSELRGHLYLYAGTFFLKMVHNREYQKKLGVQLASLCYLLAYQIPRPKSRPSKGEPAASQLLDLLACDRKSQSGHMLLSLAQEGECFKKIVEDLGNEPGKKLLFEDLFGQLCPAHQSFIANDNIRGVSTKMPEISDLEKLDSDAVLLCGESLQELTWLGLQLVLLGRRPCFGAWLKKLFPRHSQETFKLDSNATESICLLDLEVFLCGVVFTSPLLQTGHGVLPPCCLPLQIIGQLATERQSEWWDDACCFINRKVTLSNTARVQKTIQCGLDTLKGIGTLHGLQPALLICWAQHLSYMGHSLRSCDKRAYIGRSVHYWAVVKPLLQDIKANRGIPIPLEPLFPHVPDKDIQVSAVVGYENEAETVFAVLQDIKGETEHAISILENTKTISAFWHLAQIFKRREEAANSSEKAEYLQKIRKYLTKVCQADAADLEKVQLQCSMLSMEELMDWLSEVRQQLGEGTEALEVEAACQELQPGTSPIFVLPEPSDPSSLSSRSLPAKSVASPSKRLVFSPKTPPQWAEDQTSMFQMLFQEMEALTNELHNWSGSMASTNPRVPVDAHKVESQGESFSPAQNLHGAPLTVATTGLSGYYSQPPAYNSQYLLRTATNLTPTKAPVYRMNSLPPQPRMYPHDQLYGAPLHFDQPAPSLLSPYGEDYYNHAVSQSTTNPTLPEPGYFTKSKSQPQPPKCGEEKFHDLVKAGFDQPSPAVHLKAGVIAQSTPAAAFKFNSNFKSNDGDFTFSSAQAKNNESLLRPLTSDMHIGTEGFLGETCPDEDQIPGQSGIFSFGYKDSSGISPTSATQSPSNQNIFAEKEKPFTFTGMSKMLDRVDKANRKQRDEKGIESDNDSTRVEEEEDGPHFEPIIPLPDKVDVKTGEEEEEEIFCSRAKLFRFESDSKEWKERGIGSIKILRHKTSGKVRLLMRRDQVLKICANHYITEDMELKLNAGSDRSWVWHAVDYADEIPKPEQLAIRFKTVEEAALFKGKFDQARMSIRQDQKQNVSPKCVVSQTVDERDISEFGAQFAKKEGEWECSVCCIRNSSTAMSCAACQNANPNVKIKPEIKSADGKGFVAPIPALGAFTFQFGTHVPKTSGSDSASMGFGSFPQIPTSFKFGTTTDSTTAGFVQVTKKLSPKISSEDTAVKPASSSSSSGFGAQFTKKPGQWDCGTCAVMNEATATSCIACQAPNPNRKSLMDSTSAVKPASSSSSSGFGAQFTKKPGQWDCGTCAVMNEATATSCIACQAPNPNRKSLMDSTSAVKPASSSCSSGFGAQFTKKPGQWDCGTCAVMNEATATSCIACQAPNPNRKSLMDSTSAVKPASSSSSSGFGAQFTKKPGQWDCGTCAVMNEATATSCIACQAPNPNRKSLMDSTSAVKPASSSSSSGFGAQFTKKPGQWDCGTCAVMNEATATSCIACQAPNPNRKSLMDSTSAVKPASSSSSSGFGAQFTKKPGQWDCGTCAVMNEATATSCIACQAPNPNRKSLMDSTSAVKPASSSSSSGFGAQFTKKPGQWDCGTCAVMNEATATSCIACQAPNPNRKSLMDSTSAVKPASSSSSSGFGAQFTKKPGQWDCGTCAVMNEATATSCIACQAPNPNRKSLMDSTSAVKPASSSSSSGFGAQFTKKPGQWDCGTCAVMNEATATSCIACQAPNPNRKSLMDSTSAVKPASSSSSSGFGAQFTKKPGQWDCGTCAVMNEATATSCIACQAPNPNRKSLMDSTSAVKPASSSSSSGFGAQFTKKPGQWDCGTCAVMNEATATSCIACQAPNPNRKSLMDSTSAVKPASSSSSSGFGAQFTKKSDQWDCETCAVRNEAAAKCCIACQAPNSCMSSKWDCDICAVRNEANATHCVTCQAPFKIQMLDEPWDCEKCLTRNESSSIHCVSCRTPNSSASFKATPLRSGFSSNLKSPEQFPRFSDPSNFKFGQADEKGPHPSMVELKSPTSSSSSGFSFSMPTPTGGFKFGIQEPVKEISSYKTSIATFESFPENSSNESKEKENHGTDVTKSYFQAQGEQGEGPTFHFKPYTLTFADLSRSSQGDFQFQHNDPDFKGFTQGSEQVSTSLQPPVKMNSSVQDEDDMYKTEENDDIQFEPVVKMPEKVDLVTGEENEDVLYSQRVKLFRFDADSSQWKERGVGNLKFLKNKENGRLRVLMRREQVLKVCANHWINTTMNLKPLSGSDRAWMWLANDFSDGDAKPEQLAAKFKTPDLAKEFKLKFEECQKLLLDIPLQTPHKLIDSGRTAHLIQKAEKMKSGLKHLKSFLTDDKAKISQDEGQVSTATASDTSRLVLKSNADSTIPTLEWEDYNLQKEPLHDGSEASLCASPSCNSPVQRALFRFGESTSDFNFSFQPIVTPTKSPSRVNQSRISVGTDEESETTQEDDRDGQFFEPIVPLPDLVDISTGEENEQVVFIHRAKLFRYSKDLQQWKERGIGDIKILQNNDSKCVRLVMRRDQVLKLCANHWITSDMKLEPMKGAEKAWVWSAFDFAEGKGIIEQLAVRFKSQEVANSFKDAFEKAKDAQENKVLVSPISPGEAPSQEALSLKPAAVMLKETSQENLSHGSCTSDSMTAALFMAHSHNPSAAVVSPPKFIFGSDSVQKIFGSPTSCTQNVSSKIKPKEKALPDSSPSFKISVSASQPSLSPMMPAFRVPEGVASDSKGRTDIADKSEDVEDVQIVFVREPTSEQARLARELLLPVTFFCYQNEPDYVSDDEDDDEDFEMAVRKLNGRLYPSNAEGATVQEKESSGKGLGDGVATCGGVPVTELGGDKCLQHPHTEADKGIQRREQLSLSAVSSSSDATVKVTKGVLIVPESQPDSTSDACPVFVAGDSCPIDLSAKKSNEPDSTTKDAFSFGIQSVGTVSFADLAKSSGEYAFGKQDCSFTWANAGATVFGTGIVSQRTEDEGKNDDAEVPSSDDVHFEPIVHLPEVEIKSGEEDEEVLFKARAKLYRWDRDLGQWKERGVGDIKILCQPQKCYYRVLMRREQVLKVCANHTITTAMELKPMSSSSNALVWTATDYSEENEKVEQLAAKFKNEELAESFKKIFEECQSRLTQVEPSQTPGHL